MEITVWVLVFYYLCETGLYTYYYIYHEKPLYFLFIGSDVEGPLPQFRV